MPVFLIRFFAVCVYRTVYGVYISPADNDFSVIFYGYLYTSTTVSIHFLQLKFTCCYVMF